MELLSVQQAAAILDVDDSRVRQLVGAGKLRGQRISNRWLLDGDSVRDRKNHAVNPGRPVSPRNAWGLLAMLADRPAVGLSDPERSRLRARLRSMAVQQSLPARRLQELLSARAEARRYRVHSGVLAAVSAASGVVRGGAGAATQLGADYVAPGHVEIYVHPSGLSELEQGFGMIHDNRRGNLLVRIPPADAWPVLVPASDRGRNGHDAPAPVVACDLLDLHEGRADAAAIGILRPLVARYAPPGEGRQ